jgi:hypothetical protein
MAKKTWKALHFVMRVVKKGNSNEKGLAYTALVRAGGEFGAVSWDPFREGQIIALDRQNLAVLRLIGTEKRWRSVER